MFFNCAIKKLYQESLKYKELHSGPTNVFRLSKKDIDIVKSKVSNFLKQWPFPATDYYSVITNEIYDFLYKGHDKENLDIICFIVLKKYEYRFTMKLAYGLS